MTVIRKVYPYIDVNVYKAIAEAKIKGIPKIYAIKTTSKNEYVIEEEEIIGETLHERLMRNLFSPTDAVKFIIKVCDIIESLHKIHIVHGDLKPENIMIDQNGNPYVIDFNASHLIKRTGGKDTIPLGTPGFAAPEQYGFSRSDERSDIYALGEILNVMITGGYTNAHLTQEPVKSVISKCVRIDPNGRFQNVSSLKRELRNYAEKRHIKNENAIPGFRTKYWWKGILSVLLYLVILFFVLMFQLPDRPFLEVILDKIYLFFVGVGSVFVLADFKHVNELFSFARKSTGLLILSKVLQVLILMGTMFFVNVLIVVYFG